jgi:hypothetical protein
LSCSPFRSVERACLLGLAFRLDAELLR